MSAKRHWSAPSTLTELSAVAALAMMSDKKGRLHTQRICLTSVKLLQPSHAATGYECKETWRKYNMANVSVGGPIVFFPSSKGDDSIPEDEASPDYLINREMTERAAAKGSATLTERRIHQQLAQMYADRRRANARESCP